MKHPINEIIHGENIANGLEQAEKAKKLKKKVKDVLGSYIKNQTKSGCPQRLGNYEEIKPKNPWGQRGS